MEKKRPELLFVDGFSKVTPIYDNWIKRKMDLFREQLNLWGLIEVSSRSSCYAWSNNRDEED